MQQRALLLFCAFPGTADRRAYQIRLVHWSQAIPTAHQLCAQGCVVGCLWQRQTRFIQLSTHGEDKDEACSRKSHAGQNHYSALVAASLCFEVTCDPAAECEGLCSHITQDWTEHYSATNNNKLKVGAPVSAGPIMPPTLATELMRAIPVAAAGPCRGNNRTCSYDFHSREGALAPTRTAHRRAYLQERGR